MWKDYIDWSAVLPDYRKVFVSFGDNEVLKGDIETWLDIANLTHSDATDSELSGCKQCLSSSGIHDTATSNLQNSPIFNPVIEFVKENFA